MTTARSNAGIPRPPRRLLTRIVLPAAIMAGAIAAVLWSGWRTFAPATEVRVVQVVLKSMGSLQGASGTGEGAAQSADERLSGPSVQAPGWVEPAPYPTMVSALTPGVVKSILVLEGERVAKGQVLVELHGEEQEIALQLAQAMQDEQAARRAEMADELQRKEKLVAGGAVPAAEVARLRLRLVAMDAAVRAAQAERDMKALAAERTKVRAPSDGVVMARLASPGMAAGAMQDGKPLIELYDPASLQVRADVPLADAGLIAIGQPAEIQVDVLPNRVFRGRVTRVLHQADIAKNTVQAKVAILEPAPELKPEMLARVRIFASRVAEVGAPAQTRERIWAPALGLRGSGASATALVVTDLRDGIGVAQSRAVALTGAEQDGWLEVQTGLRAGDLLVTTDSPPVASGERVRVLGSASDDQAAREAPHANH